MPLHLLGKKSWNVYNAGNIERVRRDEAAAKAAEEAEEQRMQEIDALRRLAILRGEAQPPPVEDGDGEHDEPRDSAKGPGAGNGRPKRKRKRHGEDDTDFELRLAKERAEPDHQEFIEGARKSSSSAPIVDRRGHIDLFGDEKARAHAEKNEDAEREAQKRKREYEDQYTMRFSKAAGREGARTPWYSQGQGAQQDTPLRDVWGNDDPKRKQRDADRITANDPLSMMKKGASRVRELNKERQRLLQEREQDVRQMRKEDKRRERRGTRRSASPESTQGRRRRSRERGNVTDRNEQGGGASRSRSGEEQRHSRRHESRRHESHRHESRHHRH
ncbi:uncharacterized protein UV8b_00761 [Ustilaginoidea virens]|uniref:CBF1-interacting co-repressor CIR N-terminal domain-containing protein n=1 Tax=Ustilaginoidea virens TaxID=1159556 RepID=A0A8E5HJD4_USTVR|nr:uncharacterized protein UV8b_00761 [Ustilaginoidea virens]QUC16520.1 hypothetical protein UV8b_00761 [Ustilaginoidea virens]